MTTHATPPLGWHTTPCCGKPRIGLPIGDRLTRDPARVTCRANMKEK